MLQKRHRRRSSPSDWCKEEVAKPRRTPTARQGRRVKFEERFPIQDVQRGSTAEKTSHMNVPPGWAALDCGAARKESFWS